MSASAQSFSPAEPLKKLKMSVHSADLLLSGLIQQQLNLKGTKL